LYFTTSWTNDDFFSMIGEKEEIKIENYKIYKFSLKKKKKKQVIHKEEVGVLDYEVYAYGWANKKERKIEKKNNLENKFGKQVKTSKKIKAIWMSDFDWVNVQERQTKAYCSTCNQLTNNFIMDFNLRMCDG